MILYMAMKVTLVAAIPTNILNFLGLRLREVLYEVAVLVMTKMCQVNTKRHFEQIVDTHSVVSKHSVADSFVLNIFVIYLFVYLMTDVFV